MFIVVNRIEKNDDFGDITKYLYYVNINSIVFVRGLTENEQEEYSYCASSRIHFLNGFSIAVEENVSALIADIYKEQKNEKVIKNQK